MLIHILIYLFTLIILLTKCKRRKSVNMELDVCKFGTSFDSCEIILQLLELTNLTIDRR